MAHFATEWDTEITKTTSLAFKNITCLKIKYKTEKETQDSVRFEFKIRKRHLSCCLCSHRREETHLCPITWNCFEQGNASELGGPRIQTSNFNLTNNYFFVCFALFILQSPFKSNNNQNHPFITFSLIFALDSSYFASLFYPLHPIPYSNIKQETSCSWMPFCNETNCCSFREGFNGQQLQQRMQITVINRFFKAVHTSQGCEIGKATARGQNTQMHYFRSPKILAEGEQILCQFLAIVDWRNVLCQIKTLEINCNSWGVWASMQI